MVRITIILLSIAIGISVGIWKGDSFGDITLYALIISINFAVYIVYYCWFECFGITNEYIICILPLCTLLAFMIKHRFQPLIFNDDYEFTLNDVSFITAQFCIVLLFNIEETMLILFIYSIIIILWQSGRIQFDRILLINAQICFFHLIYCCCFTMIAIYDSNISNTSDLDDSIQMLSKYQQNDDMLRYLMMIILVCIGFILVGILFIEICNDLQININHLITQCIFAPFEKIEYEYLYKAMNGRAPTNIYQLNYQNDDIYDCSICGDLFGSREQSVLRCGHRFHNECLRKMEIYCFYHNPSLHSRYKCIVCQNDYNWTQKWKYNNIDKHLFKISSYNELLSKYKRLQNENEILLNENKSLNEEYEEIDIKFKALKMKYDDKYNDDLSRNKILDKIKY